jgi:hypothetical protein
MISAAGYAVCCVLVYYRAPELVAITSVLSVFTVVSESLWNAIRVTPAERIMVVLPTVLDVSLILALACQAVQRADTFSRTQVLEFC